MPLPCPRPRELVVPPRPDHGLASAVPVLALGPFAPACDGADDPYATAVHAFKRGDRRHADAFADRLRRLVARDQPRPDRVAIVPGHDGDRPTHLRRLAATVPGEASRLLTRTASIKETKHISDDADRWANVAGSTAAATALDGDRVLVVDDVLASGASLGMAASTLREAGAGRVTGAVLGVRVPSPHELTVLPQLEATPHAGVE